MFAWMTHLKIRPERITDFLTVWHREFAPEVENQEGNISTFLIDVSGTGKEFLSLSVWKDRITALKFHGSRQFGEMTGRLEQLLLDPARSEEAPLSINMPR